MLAAYVEAFDAEDPAAAVTVGERPDPEPDDSWTVVDVRAAALNRHDVFSALGVGLKDEQLPMILGTDAAGIDSEGREILVHAVISDPDWSGDEMLDPTVSLFSERHQGTMGQLLAVPERNLVPKPPELSFAEAACLPTAWLTAYRMLFNKAEAVAGQTVLVQGATGGLSTAVVMLGKARGLRMWVTSRSEEGRQLALDLGADAAFETGERLPERVDVVIDAVGAPTWRHSMRCLKRGGAMIVPGGTGGLVAEAEIARIFALNLRILGATMGSREELEALVALLLESGIRPPIDRVIPLSDAPQGMAAMVDGGLRGKIVLEP
jgi:NADPH:quinone reductase-like Zn-dependent oxidoreductase